MAAPNAGAGSHGYRAPWYNPLMPEEQQKKVVCTNKKAYHDYHVSDKLEAGISLTGTEVKSLREGKANLKESYVQIKAGEVFLVGCHISPYSHGNIYNHDPVRQRKLLLHASEIRRLEAKVAQRGFTLLALKIYFTRRGKAKVELGLGRGKKLYDKREALKERATKREVERAMKAGA